METFNNLISQGQIVAAFYFLTMIGGAVLGKWMIGMIADARERAAQAETEVKRLQDAVDRFPERLRESASEGSAKRAEMRAAFDRERLETRQKHDEEVRQALERLASAERRHASRVDEIQERRVADKDKREEQLLALAEKTATHVESNRQGSERLNSTMTSILEVLSRK